MTNQHVPDPSALLTRPPNWHHPRHSKPPWITAITHTHSRLFLSESGSPIRKFFSSSFFEYTALGSSSGTSTLGVSANLTTQSPQSVFLCKINNKNYVNKLIMLTKKIPSKLSYVKLVCNEFFEIRRINQFFLKTIIFSTLPCLHFSIFAI